MTRERCCVPSRVGPRSGLNRESELKVNDRRQGGKSRKKPTSRPSHPGFATGRQAQAARAQAFAPQVQIVERDAPRVPAAPTAPGPFRIVIAVHRPRYRGRCERAAALEGWEVTSLLNRQDPVGLVAKKPGPPDLLILSGDFGRQKDYAIFRAVQPWREKGMRLVGLADDCETPPEGFPDSAPQAVCDVCLAPPYTAVELRAVFARLYTEMRGKPAPPPMKASAAPEEDEE